MFVGRLAGIDDAVGFHADTLVGSTASFSDAVDDYVETSVKAGKSPEKPCSGNLMFRVTSEVHARAVRAARLAGESLDQRARKP